MTSKYKVHEDCLYLSRIPFGEEEFLFYLICDLAKFEVEDPNDLVFGEIMAYFWLQGKSLECAKISAMEIKEVYCSHKVYFYEE